MGLGDIFEFFGGFLLFYIAFGSISVGVVFEGECFVGFLYFCLCCCFGDAEDGIVIFFLGEFFLLFCLLYFGLHVGSGVKLLDFAVIVEGGGVVLSLHVELGPSN